jgi:hypothetical protein
VPFEFLRVFEGREVVAPERREVLESAVARAAAVALGGFAYARG